MKKALSITAVVLSGLALILCFSRAGIVLSFIALGIGITMLFVYDKKTLSIIAVVIGGVAFVISIGLFAAKTTTSNNEVAEKHTLDTKIWSADYTPITDFWYTADAESKTITLNKYSKMDDKVTISPTYILDGEVYTVTVLGSGCFFGKTTVTSVYIPDTVTSIASNCFNGAAYVVDLRLPTDVDLQDGFWTYIHNYDVVYDNIEMPKEADTHSYPNESQTSTGAEQLGSDFANTINSIAAGFNQGYSGNETTMTIHYAGTEEQWHSKFPSE